MFNFVNELSCLIPNFIDVQTQSFLVFLHTNLIQEFQKRNPIVNKKKKIKIFFYPKWYLLTFPELTPTQAINELQTYSSKLYLPVP